MRRRDRIALSLVLILGTCNAVNLRSAPEVLPVRRELARSSLQSSLKANLNNSNAELSSINASANASMNANSSVNGTQPFNLHDYPPAIGKVFALYYSSFSGQKVTQIEARNYKALTEVPADSVVFDPETSVSLQRNDCKLVLKSHTTVMSDTRKYNLRMAEVAVCEQFFGNPCGPDAAACEIEMFAPLPYSSDQEKYIGAGMALTAHSLLCAQRTESWKRDSCALVRNRAAIAAGLSQSQSGIKLRPIPDAWTSLKLDATYELRFQEAVFATANKAPYEDSTHNERRHDVLAYTRAPPEPVYCDDLSCLIGKFQQR